MKSLLALVTVVWLGAGCDAGGGTLTGTGGATLHTGGGGSPVMTGSGGGPAGGTGTGGIPNSACSDAALPAPPLTPDIFIALDTAESMNDGFAGPCAAGCGPSSKWAAVVDAIDTVVSTTTPEVNWGLTFFTWGDTTCDTGDIAVPLGATNATGIRSQLAYRSAGGALMFPGNRPTRAAIGAATRQLSARTTSGWHVILVVTDGAPECVGGGPELTSSDATATLQAITGARTLGFPTVVAGVAIPPGPAETTLAEMAQAGGLARAASPPFAPVSSAGDLVAVMNALVKQTTTCTRAVPEPRVNDPGVSRSNIGVRADGVPIPRDGNHADGWDYTDSSLTSIQLYGSACDAARAGVTISITFFCLLF